MVHKVPAHKNLICSLKKDRAELESDAKHVCIETVPRWSGLTDSEIEVGLTGTSDLTYTKVFADGDGWLDEVLAPQSSLFLLSGVGDIRGHHEPAMEADTKA